MTPELQAACEAIFQEHKNHPVSWNKDVFRGRISTGMLDLAKEILIEKNIIYYQHPGKKLVTILNPDLVKAGNFPEAMGIVSGKPLMPAVTPEKIESPTIRINHQPKETPVPVIQMKLPQETPTEPVDESNAIKWYLRPVFIYFIWPLLGAAVFWLIAYLISAGYEELFLKNQE